MIRSGLVIACLIVVPAHASDSHNLSVINGDWFFDNVHDIIETIESGSEKDLIPVVNTLGVMWDSRDGGMCSELSPVLLRLSYSRPVEFYAWFSRHVEDYQDWLGSLHACAFTALDKSDLMALIEIKNTALSRLESLDFEMKDARQLFDALKAKLREIEVTHVD